MHFVQNILIMLNQLQKTPLPVGKSSIQRLKSSRLIISPISWLENSKERR